MNTPRRNILAVPRGLDPVRASRALRLLSLSRVAGPGQTVNSSGQIVPDLGDVQYVDRNGKQQIRIDEASLQFVTGSPRRIAARTKPADVEAVATEAAEERASLDERLSAAVANHEGRILALEGGGGGAGGGDLLALTGF